MKQENQTFTLELNGAGVDTVSEKIREFLASRKFPRSDVNRCALSAEEILLNYLELPDKPDKFTLSFGTRLFAPCFSLTLPGAAHNVCSSDSDEHSILGVNMLINLGLAPEYSYKDNSNIYQFRPKKKRNNSFVTLLIMLAAAIAVGLIGMLIPDQVRQFIQVDLLDRLHGTFLNILGCLAGPMVFLSVAWGIYGIGNAATFKRIGKRLMLRYFGAICLCILFGAAISLPLITPTFSTANNTGSIMAIFSMVLDVIPKDIVSPFVNGNTLQIIFMAIIFGIALLILGQKTRAVAKAIEQINYVIQFIIEFISKLVPYFIFIVIVGMIWSDAASVFLELKSLFLVYILVVIATQIGILAVTSVRNRVNPLLIAKKGFPTLVIAMTTASSAAAFGSNIKTCRNDYGIDETMSSFGIPLGMVIFKPCTALDYLVVSLFFAKAYSVEISLSWILIMLFSAAVLSMATPPIPGGALAAYTVLFTTLGIPAEAIAIALACDALIDFFSTGFNQFSLPFILLNQSSRLGMVDRRVLLAGSKRK